MTQWAYTPSSSDTVSTNLTIYCAQAVQPDFLSYLHSRPIPPHFMQQWAYTPIYLYRVHHQSRLLYTNCPASFPPLLAQWFHTSSFFDTVGTTLAIYCTQTAQPYFLLYLHSRPIPPHFMTQWACTPHLLTQGVPPKPSTVHKLSSLISSLLEQWADTSSFYDTVGLYPFNYLHSGHHHRHLLYTDCPPSLTPLLAQWAHTSSCYDKVGLYSFIYLHSGHHPIHLLYTDCPASLTPLLAEWAYTSSCYDKVGLYSFIYLHSGHHPIHLLYTDCPASLTPLLAEWAYTSSCYDKVGLCSFIYLHSGHHPIHLLYTDCPASLTPLLAEWAYTSSCYDKVGLYSFIYLHSGHHPIHLLYTDCPASLTPIRAQWAHTSSF